MIVLSDGACRPVIDYCYSGICPWVDWKSNDNNLLDDVFSGWIFGQ